MTAIASRKKIPIDLSLETETLYIRLSINPDAPALSVVGGHLPGSSTVELLLPVAWLRELLAQAPRSLPQSPMPIRWATLRQPAAAFLTNGTMPSGHNHSQGCDATCFAFHLTPRESAILDLMAAGLSNLAIAQRLMLCEKTVKNHINHIFAKLAVNTRSEAIALWLGNLDPEFRQPRLIFQQLHRLDMIGGERRSPTSDRISSASRRVQPLCPGRV